ncbi:MAG: branched-chain amino acid ABC transporter permease [Hyphomicrobiaceae bacterium]|nr:branched-chain amino acid ABC transporter permease [Hyphomicrobiaceae bacterium]
MTQAPRLLPETKTGWAALAVGAIALALMPLFASPYHVELGTTALIAALLALSLQLLVGVTGLVSLGHGAFYGLAAYIVYFLSPEGSPQPIWLTLPIAMLVAGLAAALVGLFALRTKGFFFLMVTLAFGQMIFFVFHDTKIGGGTDGAYLAKPIISAFGMTLDLPRRQRPIGTYYVALTQLIITYLALAWLLRTLFGRVLEGIRVNEHRMQALGHNTQRAKLIAFSLAGALAGAAGHMWAMHRGFVNPEIIGWHKSAEALLMILLGGLGALHGPIIGALAYTGLTEVAGLMTERKLLVEGLVILLAVIVLPKGLSGIRLFSLAKPSGNPHDPLGDTDPSQREVKIDND